MYKYISWDPGKTTGVVCWNEAGEPVDAKNLTQSELDIFLKELVPKASDIKEFIIEKYIVYGSKATAHVGTSVVTVEVIGQLKSFARLYNIPITLQLANIMAIAKKWSQTSTPPNHAKSHWYSAYLHGYYRLHQLGIIKAKVLEND